MKKLMQILTISMAALALLACGNTDQDPLKNHEKLKNSEPLRDDKIVNPDSTTIPVLYTISTVGEPRFVQGQLGRLTLKVETYFSEPTPYRLEIIKDPQNMPPNGLTLTAGTGNEWILSWKPNVILSEAQLEQSYNIKLKFVPLSPLGIKEFIGVDPETPISFYLSKDRSQPFIEENIKVSPGNEVNPDQKVTFTFVATAHGLTKPDDIQIDEKDGPTEPGVNSSVDMLQLNGKWGLIGQTQRVRSLGMDSQGRLRQEFKMTFHARHFVEAVMQEINRSGPLKAAFDSGKLTSAEAVFSIKAKNIYNDKSSAARIIRLKVNLRDKPGPARFMGEAKITALKAGMETSQYFDIRSEADRGEVKVLAVRLGDQPIEPKNGVYAFSQETVQGTFTCKPITLLKYYSCDLACAMNCVVEASATCDSRNQTMVLEIDTESKLGPQTALKTLKYQINVRGKSPLCEPPPQPIVESKSTEKGNVP